MAERYEDDELDQFEDKLEDEETEDELEDEVIDFGSINRQKAEAEAKRVPVRINGTVYRFLPADQWAYTTWKAVDPDPNRLPNFDAWIKDVLPKEQATRLLALDLSIPQYSELLFEIQKVAEGKVLAARKARRSGDPRKRRASRA